MAIKNVCDNLSLCDTIFNIGYTKKSNYNEWIK